MLLAAVGAFSGYMASQEATANANRAAWANYLNQEHQGRLAVQRQNDQLLQQYRKQFTQNLFIEKAATRCRKSWRSSCNREYHRRCLG